MSIPSRAVADALSRWRSNLIDLTRRNPLIALRPSGSSMLTLSHPKIPAIWQRLVRDGKACTFWLPPAEAEGDAAESEELIAIDLEHIQTKPSEIVCGDLGRQALLRTLTNLYRRAGAEFRERGLHILHVAFGILEWRDTESNDSYRSPLVLVPVQLERQSLREPFSLSAIEDELILNPALTARLQQDFDFQLPAPPEAWDETDVSAYLAQVETAIAGLPGWRVDATALLSLFSFFKGVMYHDLEENAGLAEAHPLVRALAGEQVGAALTPTDLPTEDELDNVQLPEETFTILDADASQRLCLEAATRGHSFVLHGPPGTGKSQTIANLIAQCLAEGKKVLFVSDKMAALEVVYNRLRAAGLADYCLELHSHKANKRAVVQELKRCFEESGRSNGQNLNDDFVKLQQRRDHLTKYAQALHQPREPLQRSVWWAIGELTRCAQAPSITWRLADGVETTPNWLDESRQAVQRAQQLWHIVEQGKAYLWWGFKAGDRYTLQLREEIAGQLEKARKQLDRLMHAAEHYSDQIGAKGSVAWLLRAGELLESSPKPPVAWLTATDLPQLAKDLESCAELYKQRGQSREPLTQRYGPGFWKLPEGTAANVDQAWRQAAPLLAPGDDKGAGLLTHQQHLRGWAADTQKRIPSWLTEAKAIEKWLTVALPEGEGATTPQDTSPHWLKRLLRLAHLCASENAPERAWVVDANACMSAKALIEANQPVFDKYHQTRGQLLLTYHEPFFELELDRIAAGFAGPYQSWFRTFNMEFRRDRRAIARRSKEQQMPASIEEDIVVARDLMHDKTRLEGEQATRQAVLGRYEKGLATDFEAAQRATHIAEEAVQLVHELGHEDLPAKFVDALSAASPPPEKIRAAIKRLLDSVGAWSHATHELKDYLPLDAMPGTERPLEESALSALLTYAKNLQSALNHFASLADPVLTKATTQPPDAVTLVSDLREGELLRKQETLQESENAKWTARFGPGFQGMTTDWHSLRKMLTWTIRVREHFAAASPDWQPKPVAGLNEAGPKNANATAVPAGNTGIPPAPFIHLATASGAAAGATKDLRHVLEQFQHALHSFEIRFDPPAPLAGQKADNSSTRRLAELSLDDLKKRLTELRDRAGDLSDWIDRHHLGKRFEHLGLGEFWTELQKTHPPREQLVDVFMKSALTSWLDRVFQEESVLRDFRRQEHESVLADFREVDRKLLVENVKRVAHAADAGRPRTQEVTPGTEVATLMREAHKKTRHLPVRRLFEAIPDLLLQLKPCMLMSPLSVSQFLNPAKVQFDLVVFDEASQIRPEDAVGAVLRGQQVIVTGDDKQLPPTNFFQQLADDDFDDEIEEEAASFESVLDACLGAGVRPHFLRWHYRSRHEGLIAYSNQEFYDNRLITFPGPLTGDEAIGVQFCHVADGVYDRGGRRDNPREAQVVADLVLQHYRQFGDSKTIGVIAFSQAQMFAIEDEIDRRLLKEPELEPLFKADRLGGFFVKNLETVQGDERDIILLSVGYGRDANGKFAMHFGPLNREGGQRRLNVAVTRAREHLVVISSIKAADIDLNSTKAAGVHHLHRYLDFAERGLAALDQVGNTKKGAMLSPPLSPGQFSRVSNGGESMPHGHLQIDVMEQLQKLGYTVVPQVGCGGCRIDLGVIDPNNPGRFFLGIECDGPAYHDTPTARDRDRLRQEVLEKLGWQLHRVWSIEWFQRRHQEVERLREALEAAKLACARIPVIKQQIGPISKTNDNLPSPISDSKSRKEKSKVPVLRESQ